ncbi:hypothetical protein DIV22_20235 [Escherichia coli]|uniref:Uncharacterized protein n=1 Tax=Escherichia coli TaxID=562 RepID=A0A2W8GKQ4_ECOLX|nr:hypothetical protein DIV22_20235 [Escherichia coli]
MRAAYERVLRTSSEKTDSDDGVVTTFIIKSDSVPALRAGAGPLFSYEGGALWFQFCAGQGFFWWLSLCVVTKVAPVGARRLRWEVHICLSTGQAVNRFSF